MFLSALSPVDILLLLSPLDVFNITSDFISFVAKIIISYYLFKYGLKEILVLRSKIMLLFGSFIFASAILHLTHVINIFYPIPYVIACVRLWSAVSSTMAATAVLVVLEALKNIQDLNVINKLKELKELLIKIEF